MRQQEQGRPSLLPPPLPPVVVKLTPRGCAYGVAVFWLCLLILGTLWSAIAQATWEWWH